jgi:hypothetical protein
MALILELAPELEARLAEKAQSLGLSLNAFAVRTLSQAAEGEPAAAVRSRPYRSLYGALARYGPGPTEEDIDQSRAEMLRNFGDDAP